MPVLASFYSYFWNLRAHNGELPRVHKRPPNSPPNGVPNGSGKANHFGAVSGPPRVSKTPLRTARNQLVAASGPLFRDHFRPTPRQQNTAQDRSEPLGATSGPLREHSGTTSEPPWGLLTAKHRSGPLKTSSGQLRHHFGTTSEPPRGLQTAKQRSVGPLNASRGTAQGRSWASRPQDTAANRSTPARDQLRLHYSSAFWASKPQNTARDR